MQETGLRENLIANAIEFLQDPRVAVSADERKKSFLKGKGMTDAEIDEAMRRVGIPKVVAPTLPNNFQNNQTQLAVQQAPPHPVVTHSWKMVAFLFVVASGFGQLVHYGLKKYIVPFFLQYFATKKKEKKSKEPKEPIITAETKKKEISEGIVVIQQFVEKLNSDRDKLAQNPFTTLPVTVDPEQEKRQKESTVPWKAPAARKLDAPSWLSNSGKPAWLHEGPLASTEATTTPNPTPAPAESTPAGPAPTPTTVEPTPTPTQPPTTVVETQTQTTVVETPTTVETPPAPTTTVVETPALTPTVESTSTPETQPVPTLTPENSQNESIDTK